MKSGPLIEEYKKVGIFYLYPLNLGSKNELVKFYIFLKQKLLIKLLFFRKFDLIYSNTILNSFILQEFSSFGIPIVTHVHEMGFWLRQLDRKEFDLLRKHTSIFLTASKAVSNSLEEFGIVKSDYTFPVYAFADEDYIFKNKENYSLKKYLNIPQDSILIGACGAENYRKGKDWFIPIASGVLNMLPVPNVHFVWIGGTVTNEIEFDRFHSGFSNQIHFINHLPNAHLFFSDLSLFLMISREDPFPIVNIEAGIQSVPVLSFFGNGGTEELLEDDPILLVPFGDLKLMSERIVSLLEDPRLLKEKGRSLQKKIRKKYTKDLLCNAITDKIVSIHLNGKI